jgi:hypothetical protein
MHPGRRYHPDSFRRWLLPGPTAAPSSLAATLAANDDGHAKSKCYTCAPQDDVVIIDRIKSIKPKLWAGESHGYPSTSEADLALCNLITWLVGPDEERILRIVRQSGLWRDKWQRDDYRTSTIAKAMDRREYFDWSAYGQGEGFLAKASAPDREATL